MNPRPAGGGRASSWRWGLTLGLSAGTVGVGIILLLAALRPEARLVAALALLLATALLAASGTRAWRLLLPLWLGWGRFAGLDTDAVRRALIETNNRAVLGRWQRRQRPPRAVRFLFPLCLQHADCEVKITGDIDRCRDCGRCVVPELRRLAKLNGIKASVVTGGTEARRQAADRGLELIIACACERDLLAGILDSPVPVYGLVNQRPEGPCRNTQLDLEELRQVLAALGLKTGPA